jgi:hypothetical protein
MSPQKASRRSFLAGTTFVGLWGLATPETHALQERNEALCGTGFFTNIWQYKCTDLGDIEDEGMAKELSHEDQGTVDSLMAKLNLEIVNVKDTDAAGTLTHPLKQRTRTRCHVVSCHAQTNLAVSLIHILKYLCVDSTITKISWLLCCSCDNCNCFFGWSR